MPAPTRPLISPAELAALLRPVAAGPDTHSPVPVVLDVRWRLSGPSGRGDHDAGHVPGAVFLDLGADLAGAPGPAGRHPLPEPQDLQEVLRRAGVRTGSPVVVHDLLDASTAARAWWLLRWAGLPADRVRVLDGGWAAWVAEGHPVTAEPSRPARGDVEVAPGAMPVLDADAAARVAATGVLVDARAGERYRGEIEPVDPVAGHIPGAVNLPATEIAGPDGRWPAPAELATRLTGLGLTGRGLGTPGGAPAGAYCGSGVTAAAIVLAAEHAGLRPPTDPLPLYVGSWSNWTADPSRPVATGAAP